MQIWVILLERLGFRGQRRSLQRLTKYCLTIPRAPTILRRSQTEDSDSEGGSEMNFEEAMLRISDLTSEDSEYVDITTLYKTFIS